MVGVTAKVLSTLKALVMNWLEEANVPYHAPIRYRVVQIGADKRLHLQIIKRASGFPDALPIAIWPGVPGGAGEPKLGSTVLVQFIEGDPSLPIVTHFASPHDSAFFVPANASLDATTLVRLGEHADLTQLGSGSITHTGTNSPGRLVRWGDTYVDPTSGPTVLLPGPFSSISKVKA